MTYQAKRNYYALQTEAATLRLGEVLSTAECRSIMAAAIEWDTYERQSSRDIEKYHGKRPTRKEVEDNALAGYNQGYATCLRNTLTMMVGMAEGVSRRTAHRVVADEIYYATEELENVGHESLWKFLSAYYG
jgi:hypothetical protein